MVSFGAVIVEPGFERIFYGQLKPISEKYIPEALSVSAKTGLNLDQLREKIADKVCGRNVRVRVTSSAGDGKLQSYLHTVGSELEEEYSDSSVQIDVTLGKNQLAQLKRLGAKQIELL